MAESFSNSLISNSIYHLLNFEKYSSFQMAAREAAINNNFQIVLFTEDFNTIFSVETRHKATIDDAVRQWLKKDESAKEERSVKVDVYGITTYWGPIGISGVKYYMMLVDNEKMYSQDDIVKLAEIIELAIGMWNYLPERDTTAEFVRALRRGNRGLAHSLLGELELDEKDCEAAIFIPNIPKEESIKIISDFEEANGLKMLRVNEGGELAGVIVRTPDEKEFGYSEWKALGKQLNSEGSPKTFYVEGTQSVDDLCNAFQVINETEAFVQLIFPRKHSFSKYELALADNCVNICMKGGLVKQNYLDLIKPFQKERDTKGRQLIETLAVFVLDAGLSSAKTAKILNIHANTVGYRLKRIKEILGVDITASTIVPGLMTALAISRIEKEVKSF